MVVTGSLRNLTPRLSIVAKESSPHPSAGTLKQALDDLLAKAVGLPEGDVSSIGVLIDAGEWQLALEILCTQMFEYGVVPQGDSLRSLLGLGDEIGVNVARLFESPH